MNLFEYSTIFYQKNEAESIHIAKSRVFERFQAEVCYICILASGPTNMEAKIHLLVTALLVALMSLDLGMSTVVTGKRVPRRSVAALVPAGTGDDQRPQVHSPAESVNLTGCEQGVADATNLLTQFAPCISAVSIVSEPPTRECCDQLQAEGPSCLCSLFTRYRSQIPEGVVSVKKITKLPRKCEIPIPEEYVCDGVAIPSEKTTVDLDSTDTPDTNNSGWFIFNP